MDPPQNTLSNRWHSSITNSTIIHHSSHKSRSPAPRNASTWDSFQTPSSNHPTVSGITRRISSVTTYVNSLAPENSDTCNIVVPRKGSAWDLDATLLSNSGRVSTSGIARRRSSVVDHVQQCDVFSSPRGSTVNEGPSDQKAHTKTRVPHFHRSFEWDPFSGPPPRNDGSSTWSWMSDIVITSDIYSAPHSTCDVTSVITQVFYAGNIEYIFKTHDSKSLAIADVEAIMHVYGVENTSALDIVRKIDPKRLGRFDLNPENQQILVASATKFSNIKEPLNILRHASKCFEDNMLSPRHFTAYIFEVLNDKYFERLHCKFAPTYPKFNILGMYGLLGVLEGSTNRLLRSKEVETFIRVWNILSLNEIKALIILINNDYRGAIYCSELYFLLYHRNWKGKQRVQEFYNNGEQDPSMLFYLLDIDKDGVLSSEDLGSFASIFGHYPSNNKAIKQLMRQLDKDGDGEINSKDFCLAMVPILDGITWEFWLVAILLTWEF